MLTPPGTVITDASSRSAPGTPLLGENSSSSFPVTPDVGAIVSPVGPVGIGALTSTCSERSCSGMSSATRAGAPDAMVTVASVVRNPISDDTKR